MAEFTKEQLAKYAKGCIEFAEKHAGYEVADKEKALFEIALASLTAEPREPDFYVVVTPVGVRQSFLTDRAAAEHIIKKPFHKGYSLQAAYFEPLEVK